MFKIKAPYTISEEQEKACRQICKSVENGNTEQTLLGVTGSGKTFTLANIIARLNRPTLVISHNKTLAAQLASEFKEFFPENAVEYFVSYYDYYQPEAYISTSDTYIEKDCAINDAIDRLRHSATQNLLERRDVIVVSSVSCLYSLGNPVDYKTESVTLRVGKDMPMEALRERLTDMQFTPNSADFVQGNFRIKGEVAEVFPVDDETALRISFWGDTIDKISSFDPITKKTLEKYDYVTIYPAKHFVLPPDRIEKACLDIENELFERIKFFEEKGKLIEKQRIEERTKYDLEMIREMGYCKGIENYSRHLTQRAPGSPPYTLLDFFPEDFLVIIDESHVSIPQIRAMHAGDRSRKDSLIEYGFRLESAYDNRPLTFDEFEKKRGQIIYVSATPSDFEISRSATVAEQIIRPTGLLDPDIIIRPTENCVADLICEIKKVSDRNERVLVTTLTKKMAEELSEYLRENNIKAEYLHSQIETIDRIKIIHDLRCGKFCCLVGVNLLREGLDIPEVSLIAIMDADKEGFLRSETSLIQTIGRAARNSNGKVVMYADTVTFSMEKAINKTLCRRKLQKEYNEKNGIIPKTVIKDVKDILDEIPMQTRGQSKTKESLKEIRAEISSLKKKMTEAAKKFDFETAIALRDKMFELQDSLSSQ